MSLASKVNAFPRPEQSPTPEPPADPGAAAMSEEACGPIAPLVDADEPAIEPEPATEAPDITPARHDAYAHAVVSYAAQIADLLGLPDDLRPSAPAVADLDTPAKTAKAQIAHACGLLGPLARWIDPELTPNAADAFGALAKVGRAMRDRRDREARELAEAQAPEPAFDGAPPHLLSPEPSPVDHAEPLGTIAPELYPLTTIATEHGDKVSSGLDAEKLISARTARLTFVDATGTSHLWLIDEPLPAPWEARMVTIADRDEEAARVARALLGGRWRNAFKRSLATQVMEYLLEPEPKYPTPLSRNQVRAYVRGEQRDAARAAERIRKSTNQDAGRDYPAAV